MRASLCKVVVQLVTASNWPDRSFRIRSRSKWVLMCTILTNSHMCEMPLSLSEKYWKVWCQSNVMQRNYKTMLVGCIEVLTQRKKCNAFLFVERRRAPVKSQKKVVIYVCSALLELFNHEWRLPFSPLSCYFSTVTPLFFYLPRTNHPFSFAFPSFVLFRYLISIVYFASCSLSSSCRGIVLGRSL